MTYIFLQILAAYVLMDIFSGLYHFVTDLGWNLKFQVDEFQNHHEKPWTMQWDIYGIVLAVPLAIVAYFIYPWFFGALAIFAAVVQIPHYYVHHNHLTPWYIKALRKLHLVIDCPAHDKHHSGQFDDNYCIFTGHNNWWMNPILKRLQWIKRK